jgi:hypothetical protein
MLHNFIEDKLFLRLVVSAKALDDFSRPVPIIPTS